MAGFSSTFRCQKLVSFIHAVSVYLRLISAYILRLQGDGSSALNKSGKEIDFLEMERLDSSEHKDEINGDECGVFDDDDVVAEEEGKSEVYLKFKFPTYDEFSRLHKETGNALNSEVVPSATVSRYQFSSVKICVSAFIDESETFPVKEGEIDSSFGKGEVFFGRNCVHDKGKEIAMIDENIEEEGFREKPQIVEEEREKQGCDELVEECRLDSDKNSVIMESDSESTSFDHMRSVMSRLVDSYSDGFLSDGDFGGEFDVDDEMNSDSEVSEFEENDEFDEEDSDIMEELKKLEEDDDNNVGNLDESKQDFDDNIVGNATNGDDDDSERLMNKDSLGCEDSNKLESLWEHQELIEQLKMELKKVRATGLPTILEESESPKISEDLKPWRIDEFQREDGVDELHKFYKSYRERMRKFDIINYQKMYAMG